MPNLTLRVILTAFLFLFPNVLEAEDKKLIFISPNAFLGSPGVSQLAYTTGFLDALYFVEKNGLPDPIVTKCLFGDEDTTDTLSVLVITARGAVRKAEKRGDKNFSVADALVIELKRICSKP